VGPNSTTEKLNAALGLLPTMGGLLYRAAEKILRLWEGVATGKGKSAGFVGATKSSVIRLGLLAGQVA